MNTLWTRWMLCASLILVSSAGAMAQRPAMPQPHNWDSSKVVQLLHADKTIGIQPQGKDSSQLLKFVGNTLFRQGNTNFACDSAFQNLTKNIIDAYGHIHIIQGDSLNIFADSLHYNANTRMASLHKNVRLTDGSMELTTPELTYDLNARIGTYAGGGRLVNGGTVLVSDIGYYYADTKDAYFKRNVVVTDPQYTLHTDSLLYNSQSRITTFINPTTINSGSSIMYTSAGFYNSDSGRSVLWNRPTVIDSSQTTTADSLFYNKLSGIDSAKGNVVWTDTLQKATILSDYAIYNENEHTLMATHKPLLIYQMDKDTLYTASDTLFSGIAKLTPPQLTNDSLSGKTSQWPDTAVEHPPDVKDTASSKSGELKITPASKKSVRSKKKSLPGVQTAPLPSIPPAADSTQKDSTYRFFMAYRHVRIYSDSLQGAADSLYYSFRDSTFRMFYNPVIWTGDNQLTGDSIYLHTKNKKAEKLQLEKNAMIISIAGPGLYNQVKGNTVDGYFRENKLDWMHVNGNAENIYYAKDDSGGFIGVNRTTAAAINIYFKDGELNRVVWLRDVQWEMTPIAKVSPKEELLRDFKWEASRRPLSKTELMK